jgi:hypothetical protein
MASVLFEWLTNQIGSLQKTNWTWDAPHLTNSRGEKGGVKTIPLLCMCVIFRCRCVCWIDGGSFTPCGYGYVLHLQARLIFAPRPCRKIQLAIFSPLYLTHVTLTDNSKSAYFCVFYVPSVLLTTFPKPPPFSSHHCSPNFNFHIYIYIYIYNSETRGGHRKAWQSMLPFWGTLLCLGVPHLWKYWWWQIKWLLLEKKKKKRN